VSAGDAEMERLVPLVGEWQMGIEFPGADPIPPNPSASVTFEWLEGKRFLVERWTAPDPAPNGIAIIGFNAARGTYLQHYFDSRGVARVYEMAFADRRWELRREHEDFSPLSFNQRFEGELSADGKTIAGQWDIDEGGGWKLDFHLTYQKVS
jgi:hypothetical protein